MVRCFSLRIFLNAPPSTRSHASSHDSNTAFAAVFARRDHHPYIFRTRDGGKTWDKIVTGLPETAIARVVREDPVRKGMLFAGTETGVYISFDDGDYWQSLQLSLPTTSVRDLTIHGDDLVAATFGRGLWILDDISPLRQFSDDPQKSPVHFFTPQTAIRTHWDNHPDTPLQVDTPSSQNPPDGAILYYSLASPPKGEITLDVFDQKGTRLRHLSSSPAKENLPPANVPEYWFYPPASLPTAAGINRFAWDLRYPPPTALPYGFFGEHLDYTEYTLPDHAVPGETPRFQPPGPVVPPGTYDLVLTVAGKTYRQRTQRRTRSSCPQFSRRSSRSIRSFPSFVGTHGIFRFLFPESFTSRIADCRPQESFAGRPSKELTDAVADLEKRISALQSGTELAPGFGTLNRDLGRYLVMVQGGDIAPSESVQKSFRFSCDAYAKNIAAETKLTVESLPALNKMLAANKLAALTFVASSATPVPACVP